METLWSDLMGLGYTARFLDGESTVRWWRLCCPNTSIGGPPG